MTLFQNTHNIAVLEQGYFYDGYSLVQYCCPSDHTCVGTPVSSVFVISISIVNIIHFH